MRWIRKDGVLGTGARVFREGDSIPPDLLSEDRVKLFVELGYIDLEEEPKKPAAKKSPPKKPAAKKKKGKGK